MKKVIDGKKYNTETAQFLAETECGNRRSPNWFMEALYNTKAGNFFLYGKGNAASRYAEATEENGWEPGEKIVPITKEQAQIWADEHMSAHAYEAMFGKGSGEEKFVQISAKITVRDKKLLDKIKEQSNKTTSGLIPQLLADKQRIEKAIEGVGRMDMGRLFRLYDYMDFLDAPSNNWVEEIMRDYTHDYLTENRGRDGNTYCWYLDESHDVCICYETGEILDGKNPEDNKKIEDLFC